MSPLVARRGPHVAAGTARAPGEGRFRPSRRYLPARSASRDENPGDVGEPPLDWTTRAGVVVFYILCVGVATYPLIRTIHATLPDSLYDPLQHLWIMRWYRTCLLEGRWPSFCPEIQHPVGAPLGNFSPLYLQSLIFIPLSLTLKNDVLSYNLLWMGGFVFTGCATFLLIWEVLRDRSCALLGGLLTMLSGPMLLHSKGHLELLYVGCFPLFHVAWLRFVDAPSRGRLASAVGLYWLVALCSSYFLVFATVPAALDVLDQGLRALRQRDRTWLRTRAAWLAGFALLALPGLLILFAPLLWSMSHGYTLPRPFEEFAQNGAPLWTYLVPTKMHLLSVLLPCDAYEASGIGAMCFEQGSYLGIVALALVSYAAARVVRFPRAGYWWAAAIVLIILGGGAYWRLGPHQVPLPGLWLRRYVLPFQMIRVPARFNLFVAVLMGLIAAAGLRHLLARLPRRAWRGAACGALAVLAVADLSPRTLARPMPPPVPPLYDRLLRQNPHASFLEIPQYQDGGPLDAYCAFFQSSHRGRTNVGYSGQSNAVFDDLLVWNSPFWADRLADPEYLGVPDDFLNPHQPGLHRVRADVVRTVGSDRVRFGDYAWLYATVHGFDYLILHDLYQWDPDPLRSPAAGRLRDLLRGAKVYEDGAATVYDRNRMEPPKGPVLMTTRGWRANFILGAPPRVAERIARLAVFSPAAERPYRIVLEAQALGRTRTVRLLAGAGGAERARWSIPPDTLQPFRSAPFRLPPGVHELLLVSDAEERPRHPLAAASRRDTAPYSLRVASISLCSCSAPDAETPPPPQIRPSP